GRETALSSPAARPVGGRILRDRISTECPGEILSMPLPTVDKEFLPSDLLKLPRSPNVDGPKKPFVGLGASEIHRSVGSPRSGLSRTSGPGLSLLSNNRQRH